MASPASQLRATGAGSDGSYCSPYTSLPQGDSGGAWGGADWASIPALLLDVMSLSL